MSVQIFLQGKLTGVAEFLGAPIAHPEPDEVLTGRAHWVSLLSEVLPRAVLAELGLARILLGSSGGGQFLLVLPEESRVRAHEILTACAAEIRTLSGARLRLIWAVTENLGDWTDIRKRLQEQLRERRGAPGYLADAAAAPADEHFASDLGSRLREIESIGWSAETPGRVLAEGGAHRWPVGSQTDAIPFARHAALRDDGDSLAAAADLAARAQGRAGWGFLRGDVDHFGVRFRRVSTIEEHIQLSVLYKQFFAGEIEVLASMPEFWRKVTVLYSGGDDFAVYGAWDALIPFARELQRLFHRFAEESLKDLPGPEGKTITMALALAPAADSTLATVFELAGERLETAKSADKDCFWLLGRTLEWKQFTEASDLKDSLLRMVDDFGCSPRYLGDLCSVYRETQVKLSRRQARRTGAEKPWRYHRRITRIIESRAEDPARRREFEKAQTALIADLIGRAAGYVKLRPAGRVALEWARLARES